jgi:hypothetical protein
LNGELCFLGDLALKLGKTPLNSRVGMKPGGIAAIRLKAGILIGCDCRLAFQQTLHEALMAGVVEERHLKNRGLRLSASRG